MTDATRGAAVFIPIVFCARSLGSVQVLSTYDAWYIYRVHAGPLLDVTREETPFFVVLFCLYATNYSTLSRHTCIATEIECTKLLIAVDACMGRHRRVLRLGLAFFFFVLRLCDVACPKKPSAVLPSSSLWLHNTTNRNWDQRGDMRRGDSRERRGWGPPGSGVGGPGDADGRRGRSRSRSDSRSRRHAGGRDWDGRGDGQGPRGEGEGRGGCFTWVGVAVKGVLC